MSTPPQNSIGSLNRAREAAARVRGEWLLLLRDDLVGPNDVLTEASTPDGRPLLKLSLRQLLLARPGWGRKRTEAVIRKVSSVATGRIEARQITVGWLLDPRSGGRRFAAWLDALEPKTGPAWPGFPFVRKEQ
jgi:hypothetical protein